MNEGEFHVTDRRRHREVEPLTPLTMMIYILVQMRLQIKRQVSTDLFLMIDG